MIGPMHFVSAALMFSVLAAFCLCQFTRSGGDPTREKLRRNKVYVWSGWIIVGCMGLALLHAVLKCFLSASDVDAHKPLFWLEAVMLLAFGVAWFVKGDTLLRDAQTGRPG